MSISIANALIACKNLLDNGIVSQEYFEKKKEETVHIKERNPSQKQNLIAVKVHVKERKGSQNL